MGPTSSWNADKRRRAVWIALRSRFAFKPVPEPLHFALLERRIADKDFGQSYLVVDGEKGVGKTCLLEQDSWSDYCESSTRTQRGHHNQEHFATHPIRFYSSI
jgi:hypothetical protein